MLSSLFIRDFAIIQQVELNLDPRLTVLTGETGAGKSILVDALALALGARADAELIRDGAESSEITAGFDLPPNHGAVAWLRDQELYEEETCIVRRLLYNNKPSKAFINGRPVTLNRLREFGDRLVDIHGQHEHQSLIRRDAQRSIVDDFAQLAGELTELARYFKRLNTLTLQLESMNNDAGRRLQELDLLRFQTTELDGMNLERGEFAELEREQQRLSHAHEIQSAIERCAQPLYDDDGVTATRIINQSLHELNKLLEFEPGFAEVIDLLDQAAIQIDEAVGRLRRISERIDADPSRLQALEDRMSAVLDVARKHRCEPDQLIDTLDRLRHRLTEMDDMDTSAEALQTELAEVTDQYNAAADRVAAARRDAAATLSRQVTRQMQELGMRGGRFEIVVSERDRERPTRFGYDEVEFTVSGTPGQPMRPFSKVASGGELSRISLAIQVVTAAVGRVPTLIFDEVDVGIGGRVAEIVGRKLRELGTSRQVLCVTHLAQVAAQGHRHLWVRKHQDRGVRLHIEALDGKQRIAEIARMLAGIEITDRTLAHARDMLARTGSPSHDPSVPAAK